MIPTLWRYLLRRYLQVFSLSVASFVLVLLITRSRDIFSFAALGAPLYMVLLFTLYQIPYILPYAIAISSLLAAYLLATKLSQEHELTAIRAAGVSMKEVMLPVLFLSALLATSSFLIVSELTPHTRFLSKSLLHRASTANPLFLMKQSKLLSIPNSYVDMHMVKMGKEAKNVLFVTHNSSSNRLNLLLANTLALHGDLLKGEHVSLVSSLEGKERDGFDHLIIENQESMEMLSSNLTALMHNKELSESEEHVRTKRLFTDLRQREKVRPKDIKRALYEMARRLYFPSITLSFTLLGLCFGLQIGREKRGHAALLMAALVCGALVSFLIGKSYYLTPWRTYIAFFLPQLIIIVLSLRRQKNVAKGVVT